MKKHEFYKKYARLSQPERHILQGKGSNCKSSYELYTAIRKEEIKIEEATEQIDNLLKIAGKIIKK